MKIALYARVSTREKGQDTENQLLQLRQFCRQQGWEIAGEYVDQKTGRTSDREAFQRLFQDAYQKRFQMVLFWALDRAGKGRRTPYSIFVNCPITACSGRASLSNTSTAPGCS